MKNIQVFLLMLCLALGVSAQTNYQSLDPEHPIEYNGSRSHEGVYSSLCLLD